MRVVIDLQACQFATVGDLAARRTLALLPALIDTLAQQHEVILVANGELPDSARMLQRLVAAPVSWRLARWPVSRADSAQGAWLRRAAALMRDEVVAALRPDVELVLDAAAGWRDGIALSTTQSGR